MKKAIINRSRAGRKTCSETVARQITVSSRILDEAAYPTAPDCAALTISRIMFTSKHSMLFAAVVGSIYLSC